jgi:sugar/nucleoside kinase (ribokinase family)
MSRAPGAPRIDCVGPLNMDLIIRADAPGDLEKLAAWVGPSRVELLVAGSIGYTVQALARLGCAVRVFSTVGDDAFGGQILRELQDQHVDTSGVQVLPGPTSIAIYPLLFGGTKRPLTYRLSDADPWPVTLPAAADDPPADALLFGGLLHFGRMYHRGMGAVFSRARATGVVTALDPQFPLDPTSRPWLPHIKDVLEHTDVLFCDENEAAYIFDTDSMADAALAAVRHGCRVAVVKMGERGSIVADAAQLVEQPAVELPDRIDETVGAGDAFDAGFLAAYLEGADLLESARAATATAATSLVRPGGPLAVDPASVSHMLSRVPRPRIMAHR